MYNSKVLASNIASVCTDEHKAKRVTEIKTIPGCMYTGSVGLRPYHHTSHHLARLQ